MSFDEIARRAGVGVGTVYRRFPDRHALRAALFNERFADVDALARRSVEADDAWAGFRTFVLTSVEMFARDRGLREFAFQRADHDDDISEQRARLAPLLTGVVDHAHAARVLRTDCGPKDLEAIIAMLAGLSGHGEADVIRTDDGVAARCAEFVLAGLRWKG